MSVRLVHNSVAGTRRQRGARRDRRRVADPDPTKRKEPTSVGPVLLLAGRFVLRASRPVSRSDLGGDALEERQVANGARLQLDPIGEVFLDP